MLRYTHSETRKKQRQLDQVNYVNEVERLLFNAHERRRDLNAALERIAGMMSARVSGFWTTESFSDARLFLWERPGSDHAFSGDVFNQSGGENLLKYFKLTGKPFFGETKEELATVLGESGAPMRNLLAVPVKNDTCDVGVLFAADCLDTRFAFLQSVSFSFGMFAQNLRLYTMLEKQGQRDMLLDLYNRNRYETDLLKYPSRYTKSLACIYIDANGLHEINNSLGHEAGDCMLKAIADRMREYFDSEYIYRIGGDEFVAFAVDVEEAEVLRRCRDISRELEEMGYHISTGVEWSSDVGVDSMVAFIKAAEQRMYAAKKAYYEKNDRRNASR